MLVIIRLTLWLANSKSVWLTLPHIMCYLHFHIFIMVSVTLGIIGQIKDVVGFAHTLGPCYAWCYRLLTCVILNRMNLWKFGQTNSGFKVSSPLKLGLEKMGRECSFYHVWKKVSVRVYLQYIHCLSQKYIILLHCVLVTNDPIEITVPSISQHETATLAYGSWCTKTNRQLCKGLFINVINYFW